MSEPPCKEIILSLIKDDLIHLKLVTGLNEVGLNASDYNLNLCEVIFELLDIEDSPENEAILEHYLELTKKVRFVDVIGSPQLLEELAEEVYGELVRADL